MKKLAALLLSLACLAAGATVSGEIFEWEELSQPSGVVIKVFADGSIYRQSVVSSRYSMDLPPGNYSLEASWYDGKGLTLSAEENFSLAENESLQLDLLLLPSAEELFEEVEEPEFPGEEAYFSITPPEGRDIYPLLAASLIFLSAVIAIIYYFITRQKPLPEKLYDDKELVLHLVHEAGRISQREVKERTGFSSAKVSLILKELEKERRITRQKIGSKKIISPR